MSTRRQVAKSAAWAVPVVAFGVSAPATAASTATVPHATLCKLDAHNHGSKPVRVVLEFDATVFVIDVTVAGVTTVLHQWAPGGVLAVATTPIRNGDLSGPRTPVLVTYQRRGLTRTEAVTHGAIPDCRAGERR